MRATFSRKIGAGLAGIARALPASMHPSSSPAPRLRAARSEALRGLLLVATLCGPLACSVGETRDSCSCGTLHGSGSPGGSYTTAGDHVDAELALLDGTLLDNGYGLRNADVSPDETILVAAHLADRSITLTFAPTSGVDAGRDAAPDGGRDARPDPEVDAGADGGDAGPGVVDAVQGTDAAIDAEAGPGAAGEAGTLGDAAITARDEAGADGDAAVDGDGDSASVPPELAALITWDSSTATDAQHPFQVLTCPRRSMRLVAVASSVEADALCRGRAGELEPAVSFVVEGSVEAQGSFGGKLLFEVKIDSPRVRLRASRKTYTGYSPAHGPECY